MRSNWQRRLRDLLLAGGTLTVLACSSSGTGGSGGSGGSGAGPNFCCNASPDPCCGWRNCGAAMSSECACQLDGGVYDYAHQTCAPEGGVGLPDGGSADAGDAAADH